MRVSDEVGQGKHATSHDRLPSISGPCKGRAPGMADGQQGIGVGATGAINKNWSVNVGLGGNLQGGPVGARAGVSAAW